MKIEMADRASDSPYVDRVWRSYSSGVERMMSVAVSTWELVAWTQDGRVRVAVRGPETVASMADVPDDSCAVGISFAHGTSMPHLAMPQLVDGHLESPHVTRSTFVLRGEPWPLPEFDDAEELVTRLVRAGALVRDPLVQEVLAGEPLRVSARSAQRRVAAATGLARTTILQIERARQAALLLDGGVEPLDVAHRLGYYDQSHLARSLKRFVGYTATRLGTGDRDEPLSLLYTTAG